MSNHRRRHELASPLTCPHPHMPAASGALRQLGATHGFVMLKQLQVPASPRPHRCNGRALVSRISPDCVSQRQPHLCFDSSRYAGQRGGGRNVGGKQLSWFAFST
jgi:hypothetical protein